EKDEKLKELTAKIEEFKEYTKKLEEKIKIKEDENKKYREALIEILRTAAEQERKIERDTVRKNSIRLGYLTYQRNGIELQEVWHDGEQLEELYQKYEKLKEMKEKFQKLKKNVQKAKKNVDIDQIKLRELNEEEETYKMKLLNLKKEESRLEELRNKLQMEKQLHIRAIQRIRDEDRSRFNNFPILNDRFLLIKLLGRGGFSEVYKAYDLIECRYIACKIHELSNQWTENRKRNYIKHVLRETQIHKSMNHCRVVKMYDMFLYDDNTFVTVLEYCGGMDLDLYLKVHKTIPEKE